MPSGTSSVVALIESDRDRSKITNDAAERAMSPRALQTSEPSTRDEGVAKAQKDVEVRFQYLADDPQYKIAKPLQIVPGFLDREKRSTVRLEAGEVETIQDIRGREADFTLDANGFCYVKAPSHANTWGAPENMSGYLDEVEALLRRTIEGCDEIHCFDARLRQNGPEGTRVDGLSYNPFARQVHVDQTESSIIARVRHLMEIKADWLWKGRVRIINVWRPIRHPVYDCPLAVADGGLREDDVIECERRRLDNGHFWDTMGVVKYREGYQWYYMSEQEEQDVVLFKGYDSNKGVRAQHCLHTAFDMPSHLIPPGAAPRESIEVRALVFTHPQEKAPICLPHRRPDMAPSLQGYLFGNSSHKVASLQNALTHEINAREVEGKQIRAIIEQWKSVAAALEHSLILKTGENAALHAEVGDLRSEVHALKSCLPNEPTEAGALTFAQQTHGKNAENFLLKQQIEGLKAER
ncbi:hypothetical protein LTR16_001128 [Cryomyces antarcticus]|uniref:Uncharacterized protein n=1 Tax=Cryomyces antarcticus TaxID=329879 RepID=A0ABR0LQG3_9PEZI|nr:hypothetical protein LTR16_001128 [Cryomyces antarcticus]